MDQLTLDPLAGQGWLQVGELLLAFVLSSFIGLERQLRGKSAGLRTQAFMDELKKHDLLVEGEVSITQDGLEGQPFVYRGFQLINREKFNELRGDQLRTWNQNGMLAIIYAHFLSLDLMRQIFARQTFQGKVTAVDSKIDSTTRNATVEATIANPNEKLVPGMFARTSVTSGTVQHYITLPQTAVTYNPYGTTVYLAVQKKDEHGAQTLTAQQTFVKAGPTRGDQVAILSGIKQGDMVITSGQMKLKTGSPVRIDNSAAPLNNPAPTPQEQ